VVSIADIPEEHSYNIHYGNDEPLGKLDNIAHPQIVFTVEDYKVISEPHVDPAVWRMWGPALDSEHMKVVCQFRGTEEEATDLAYQSHLIAQVNRYNWQDKKQIIYCYTPRAVEMSVTPDGLPITKPHLDYIEDKGQCACDVSLAPLTKQNHIVSRDGFNTIVNCRWCVSDTPDCKKICGVNNMGKCDYCESVKAERKEKDEAAKNTAV
jgi:hypothetical protein